AGAGGGGLAGHGAGLGRHHPRGTVPGRRPHLLGAAPVRARGRGAGRLADPASLRRPRHLQLVDARGGRAVAAGGDHVEAHVAGGGGGDGVRGLAGGVAGHRHHLGPDLAVGAELDVEVARVLLGLVVVVDGLLGALVGVAGAVGGGALAAGEVGAAGVVGLQLVDARAVVLGADGGDDVEADEAGGQLGQLVGGDAVLVAGDVDRGGPGLAVGAEADLEVA